MLGSSMPIPLIASTAVFHAPASASVTIGPSCSETFETSDGSCSTTVPAISATLGATFVMTFSTHSRSSSVKAPMSASGLPRAASQFSHADFIALTDPSIVVEASCAVVPAIPMFS